VILLSSTYIIKYEAPVPLLQQSSWYPPSGRLPQNPQNNPRVRQIKIKNSVKATAKQT